MRPRPLYEADARLPPDEVLARVRRALAGVPCPCVGIVGRDSFQLHVCDAERHLWSPWISIEVRGTGTGAYLRGYFGPHPSLWGIFTGLYAVQVFVFVAGLMHGWISWTLQMPATGLWVAGATLISLAGSCAANIAGEWAGAPQMRLIEGFLARELELDAAMVTVGEGGPALDPPRA